MTSRLVSALCPTSLHFLRTLPPPRPQLLLTPEAAKELVIWHAWRYAKKMLHLLVYAFNEIRSLPDLHYRRRLSRRSLPSSVLGDTTCSDLTNKHGCLRCPTIRGQAKVKSFPIFETLLPVSVVDLFALHIVRSRCSSQPAWTLQFDLRSGSSHLASLSCERILQASILHVISFIVFTILCLLLSQNARRVKHSNGSPPRAGIAHCLAKNPATWAQPISPIPI
jgi:hypothetical protein